MFDIKKAKRNDTAEFTFRRLSPSADKPIKLHVRHLGRSNKPYVDAVFTRKAAAANIPKGGYDGLMEERDQDLADIAAFCATSWENVNRDTDGKPAECTPENLASFFKVALENGYEEELLDLCMFAKIPSNFREAVEASAVLGKE